MSGINLTNSDRVRLLESSNGEASDEGSPTKRRRTASSPTYELSQIQSLPLETFLPILEQAVSQSEGEQGVLRMRAVTPEWKDLIDNEILKRFWKQIIQNPILKEMVFQLNFETTFAQPDQAAEKSPSLMEFRKLSMDGFNIPQTLFAPSEYEKQLENDEALEIIWDKITEDDDDHSLPQSADEIRAWLIDPMHHEDLMALDAIDLSGLNIKVIPSEIRYFKGVTVLDLSGNELTMLPEELVELEQIEELYLDGNHLEEIPFEMSKFEKLRILDLDDNALQTLPSGIGECKQLISISLASNRLSRLNLKVIKGLQRLKTFQLAGNQISKVNGRLSPARSFFLSLNDNELCTVSPTILARGQISLKGNPLSDSLKLFQEFRERGWNHKANLWFQKR